MKPMLARTVSTHADVLTFIQSETWAVEQKIDGQRALIDLRHGTAHTRTGQRFDRLGKYAKLLAELHSMQGGEPAWLDGEYLPKQNELWLFDFIIEDVSHSYDKRRSLLTERFSDAMLIVPAYTDWEGKADLCREILATNREGVMFKRRSAPYRQERSRHWLKYKHVHTIDCVVTDLGLDGRTNMELSLHFGDTLRSVAECSALTGDGPSVKIGDVVEVTYLYATDDHRLYQPVTPKLRTDKTPSECTNDQLVYTDKTVITALT